jgi:hypothetical protein
MRGKDSSICGIGPSLGVNVGSFADARSGSRSVKAAKNSRLESMSGVCFLVVSAISNRRSVD